jgi:hypothetical protein
LNFNFGLPQATGDRYRSRRQVGVTVVNHSIERKIIRRIVESAIEKMDDDQLQALGNGD